MSASSSNAPLPSPPSPKTPTRIEDFCIEPRTPKEMYIVLSRVCTVALGWQAHFGKFSSPLISEIDELVLNISFAMNLCDMSEVLTDNLEAKCNMAFDLWNNAKMRVDAVLYAQARADHDTPAPADHDNPALADHETQAQAEAIVETPKKKLKTCTVDRRLRVDADRCVRTFRHTDHRCG